MPASASPEPVRIPVPADLRPPLSQATADIPVIYADGCHLGFAQTVPGPCVFGDPTSQTTVVLFGDSLAAEWFPALEDLAVVHHWRLVSMTKSACPAVDVRVWSGAFGRAYVECSQWRGNALARIESERPSLVLVSDDRLYELAVNGMPVPVGSAIALWDAGLQRTLRSLVAAAGSVVLVGPTPRSRVDVPVCLAAHLGDEGACATTTHQAIDPNWLATDRANALAAEARFIDPTAWICPSDPCPTVIGGLLVYREQDHMTATFAASLAPLLDAQLPRSGR